MSPHLPYQDKISKWSSHSLIAGFLRALPPQSKVLDVGTASGTLARMCRGRSLRLFGIEPNETWAQMASPLYEKMWVTSITDIVADSIAGYEAVVLADILEHLPDPQAVLQKLVDAQSSGSLFLISVPNIANFWMRLNMIFGRFDYTDRGILDRTHLHFFTRKTLIAMVKDTGLEIVSIQVTPIPLELVSAFFTTRLGKWIHTVWAAVTKLFPTLLGYQFIVGARKP
jgi:2-polyprenyl-3-methyl-5-hydroxy-6-metoxy-1,4-benzoquinol methylase